MLLVFITREYFGFELEFISIFQKHQVKLWTTRYRDLEKERP